MKNKPGITIVGAGNVGTQLSQIFYSKGYPIVQICSRPKKATLLAGKVNAMAVTEISEITPDADIYILCISDRAIKELKDSWEIKNKLVCHTSGSTEMEVLKDLSSDYGVFYPLQTFTSKRHVDFNKVPICVEANNAENQETLYKIGKSISKNVRYIDSKTRMSIHLAAVIAGNFSNFMYVLAEEILQKQGFSFELLHPLIQETSHKAVKLSPYNAQTGPARRNDTDVIRKHLDLLKSKPETRSIYEIITKDIIRYFK
jgi:predicted short-subunit dehydrogenase-like oxidoreductase (DUF2520 family)